MKEIWKDAVGYEGYLKVSNKGRCISLGRVVRNIYGETVYKKPCFVGSGKSKYQAVTMSINGKKKRESIHRIVAKTFIPNPEGLPVVNHIDGDTHNNCVDNLEWCTYAENTRHAYRVGLANGEKIREGLKRAEQRKTDAKDAEYRERVYAMAEEIMQAVEDSDNYERQVLQIARKYKPKTRFW